MPPLKPWVGRTFRQVRGPRRRPLPRPLRDPTLCWSTQRCWRGHRAGGAPARTARSPRSTREPRRLLANRRTRDCCVVRRRACRVHRTSCCACHPSSPDAPIGALRKAYRGAAPGTVSHARHVRVHALDAGCGTRCDGAAPGFGRVASGRRHFRSVATGRRQVCGAHPAGGFSHRSHGTPKGRRAPARRLSRSGAAVTVEPGGTAVSIRGTGVVASGIRRSSG